MGTFLNPLAPAAITVGLLLLFLIQIGIYSVLATDSKQVTAFKTYQGRVMSYSPSSSNQSHVVLSQPIQTISSPASSTYPPKSSRRRDKPGNVIFTDSVPYTFDSIASYDDNTLGGNKRTKSFSSSQNVYDETSLRNHRLEEAESSPLKDKVLESITSAAAAAAVSSISSPPIGHQHEGRHDLKIAAGGQQRSYLQHQYGWASNPGSCLFSCSNGNAFGGGFGAGPSCCQLNYIQCCPNANQETFNFKNLHHGRGHLQGIGALGKGGYGYGWGPSIPYNPPPIVRQPKVLCPAVYQQPHYHYPPPPIGAGGGSLIHKGIETIKSGIHNIGHIFKDVGGVVAGGGGGWGGNGAAGYYFHRRSAQIDDSSEDKSAHSPKKIRFVRNKRSADSIPEGKSLDLNHAAGHVQPCLVYSAPPVGLGWPVLPPRPHSVGLGSLIGWARPVQSGFIGGGSYGYGYGGGWQQQHYQQRIPIGGGGNGWRGPAGGIGYQQGFQNTVCKWDYQCPGTQRCCKGACQFSP